MEDVDDDRRAGKYDPSGAHVFLRSKFEHSSICIAMPAIGLGFLKRSSINDDFTGTATSPNFDGATT